MHPKGPTVTDRYFQDSLFLPHDEKGYLGPVGKDIELDAVGRQFETHPYRLLRLHRWRPCGVTRHHDSRDTKAVTTLYLNLPSSSLLTWRFANSNIYILNQKNFWR